LEKSGAVLDGVWPAIKIFLIIHLYNMLRVLELHHDLSLPDDGYIAYVPAKHTVRADTS
jgi:hypothetical protein